ncbi:MAG: dihydrofolate reductase [Pseudomonadota bacterium]
MSMRIALVVAVARNGVIGAGGDLIWRISDDLKWFKKTTLGKPVVMGRKTFESIGKPLPGRDNIVISRQSDFAPEGVMVVQTIDEALQLAREWARASDADEICIIGGGEIYVQTLPVADRLYLTRVDAAPEGDVYFPDLDMSEWSGRCESTAEKNERNQHACEFFILDRALGKGVEDVEI